MLQPRELFKAQGVKFRLPPMAKAKAIILANFSHEREFAGRVA
jgi:hypothetical protein